MSAGNQIAPMPIAPTLEVVQPRQIERDWRAVLLMYMVRSRDVLSKSISVLTRDQMKAQLGAASAMIWATSSAYFLSHDKCIPYNVLLSELTAANDRGDFMLTAEEADKVGGFLEWAYQVPDSDLDSAYGLSVLKEVAHAVHVATPVRNAINAGLTGGEIMTTLEAGLKKVVFSSAQGVTADELLAAYNTASRPVPVGTPDVAYFNQLIGGGVLPGEEWVLIGPTGGYKTTMAIDVAASMAEAHQPVMFLGYEQSLTGGNLAVRMLSRLSGLPVSVLREIGGESPTRAPTVEEREAIYNAMKAPGCPWEYLTWMDRSSTQDSVEDIAAIVGNMDRKPEMIFVDQLLTWLIQLLNSDDMDRLASKGRDILLTLKQRVFEKFKTTGLVLHQLTAAENSSSHTKKFTHSDSAGIKGIAFWVDGVINMHHYDPDSDTLMLRTTKARRSQRDLEVFTTPVPDYGRLRLKTGVMYSERDGRIIAPTERGRIPG